MLRKSILIILLCVTTVVFAAGEKLDLHEAHKKLLILQRKGKKDEAEALAVKILTQYPKDVDSQVMLAYIYYHRGDFESSKMMLDYAKSIDPSNPDIGDMEKLIADATRIIPMKHTADKNPVVLSLLAYLKEANKPKPVEKPEVIPPPPEKIPAKPQPTPPVAETEKGKGKVTNEKIPPEVLASPAPAQQIAVNQPQQPNEAAPSQPQQASAGRPGAPENEGKPYPPTASVFAPSNLQATNVLNNVVATPEATSHLLNQIGLAQQSIYATSPYGYWDYTNLYYTRQTDVGMFIGGLNYASRFGFNAFQGTVEGVINFTDQFYIDANLAYANNLELFPNWTVGVEGYVSLYDTVQVSIGDLYKAITPSYFNTYTGSIQKYIGNFLLVFRPYHYVPNNGDTSTFYTGSARYYIGGDVDHNVVVTVGYGQTPDLADLLSLNFIIVKDRSIAVDYQFPLFDHTILLDFGLSYENQRFPSGFIRQLTGANAGFRLRF